MSEPAELVGWDRTGYLLTCWPLAAGYAINRYRDSVATDTLEGIATDELLALADRFPVWCEESGTEPNGRLFWTFLKKHIDQSVWKEWRRTHPDSFESSTSDDDGMEFYWGRMLLAATDLERVRRPSMLHHDLADTIAVMPTRWKALLALRFRHELSLAEVAAAVGESEGGVQQLLLMIVQRVQTAALQLTLDTAVETPSERTRAWDIPFELHRWVWKNTRYVDVHSWLGAAQRDYHDDVNYLTDMLWAARGVQILHGARGARRPEKYAPCGTESAYQRHKKHHEQIDDDCQEAHRDYQRDRYRQRLLDDAARERGETVPDRRRRAA